MNGGVSGGGGDPTWQLAQAIRELTEEVAALRTELRQHQIIAGGSGGGAGAGTGAFKAGSLGGRGLVIVEW